MKIMESKKICYIAGPYRAACEWDVIQNIRAAEAVALKYWRMGYIVICPHKNTSGFSGAMPCETWLSGDIEILKRCDVIVMMSNYLTSEGAKAELQEAVRAGLEVIYETDL